MSEVDDWQPAAGAPGDDWEPVKLAERPAPTASDAIPEAFLDRLRAGQAIGRILSAAGKEAAHGAGQGTPTGYEDETLNHLIDMGVFHDPAKGRPGPLQMANEAVLMPAAQVWQAITRATAGGIHGAGGAFGQIVEEFGGSQGQANRAKNEVINLGNWAMIEGGMGRFSRPQVEGGAVADRVVGGLPTEADFTNAAKVLEPQVGYHGSATPFTQFGDQGPYFFSPHADVASNYALATEGQTLARMRGETVDTSANSPHVVPAYLKMDKPFEARLDDLDNSARARDPEWLKKNGYDSAILRDPTDPKATEFVVLDKSQISPKLLIEDNLRRMWSEDGIHPAEAVHDAATDAFLKNEITAKQEIIKLDPETEAILTETGGKPGSLSAAITPPEEIPIDVQPAKPPGSLAASFQSAADTLMDIGRDIQMNITPMARGTNDTRAMAKDFANATRRNRWDWSRIDDDIAKKFTPEQRARMWTAADEESVSLQLKEPAHMREHQGLATLEPAERAVVEELHTRAQNAWVRAGDVGMVEGEGLPAYTPRMIINAMGSRENVTALDGKGANLRTKTANMLKRKYMEAQETEAAAKAKYGDEAMLARDIRVLPLATSQLEDAIAGRILINNIKEYGQRTGTDTLVEGAIPAGSEAKWFTLDHPSFWTWKPRYEKDAAGNPVLEGNSLKIMKDAHGNDVFEKVPLYVHGDFEGPLRAVLSQKSGPLYGGMMALKGKTMSLIMNSPMIHNAVEFGRAFPAMPVRIFTAYAKGNRAKNDVAIMGEAIDNGLVPIGHRFFNQDISGVMESPDLTPGRSWTSKVLAAAPGLFDEAAGTAVKQAVDKAGNFWHNTLLWDRIADLQMGLYVNMRSDMMAKGIDQQTSSRIAAHMANRYAGALPKEAMSDAATKVSNFMMFSRSFTVGNLGVLKDVFTGLPKDVLAQIERDAGVVDPKAVGYAKAMARRKAFSIVMMDIALLHVANSVFQSALTLMLTDKTFGEEMHDYVRRYRDMMNETETHPLSLITPLSIAGGAMGAAIGGFGGAIGGAVAGTALGMMRRLSATYDNEPGRQDRLKIGYGKDGTAIYARSPFGKIGEEFTGYLESPIDMLKKKEGTIARPMLQVISNDKGFGRKVYDPDAETPAERAFAMWQIISHIGKSQFPEGQINAFADTVKGEGDQKVNTLQLAGPLAGVTFSRGAPGGQAVGEMYHSKTKHDFQVNAALPDIRRQIQRGDIDGAVGRMTELDIPARLQRFYIKTTLNPATRMSPRAVRDFYLHATDEQRARFERAQQARQPQ